MSHRWFLLPMLIGPVLTGACGTDIPTHSVSFDSKSYTIDRIYRSMKGPMGVQSIHLHESEQPELLWITGYRAEIADPKTGGPRSEEFMCHSNLNFDDFALHQKLFGWKNRGRKRLFTLSQGQMDVRFPKGFGVPVARWVREGRLPLAAPDAAEPMRRFFEKRLASHRAGRSDERLYLWSHHVLDRIMARDRSSAGSVA